MSNATNLSSMINCPNLKEIKGLNKINLKSDAIMSQLIYNNKSIDYLDLSNINKNEHSLFISYILNNSKNIKEIKGKDNLIEIMKSLKENELETFIFSILIKLNGNK